MKKEEGGSTGPSQVDFQPVISTLSGLRKDGRLHPSFLREIRGRRKFKIRRYFSPLVFAFLVFFL